MAGQAENIPAVHIMEMANIFGGVIDFILDPRAGDQFSILYEEQYLDGEFIGTGEILATQYTNQGTTYTAVRYIDEEGEVGFYNPEGESMRKAFLRNPLDVFRISSNFNPNRRHPILNTIRAHKGTDYAAPTGTPVRATSDGRVTWAARNGSFGNLVVLKHTGGFETKYAHLSRYAVRKGERVRQGDVIGYVGATGGATGPHLHYEFLMSGVHQNPRTVHDKLPKAESIESAEMDRFRSQTAGLLQQFSNLNNSLFLTINQPSAD
jgi:murein DD-endopeptidase MepM/ murein hydrolase activator NlpD